MSVRHFTTNKFKRGVLKEFGEYAQEEFLPDRESKEIQHKIKNEATITLTKTRLDKNKLSQNLDLAGKMFKYELPFINEPI